MTSDNAISRILLYGVGAAQLSEQKDGSIVCDLSYLSELETREKWSNYGVKAKVDGQTQALLSIHPHSSDEIHAAEADGPDSSARQRWLEAKHALKTSMAMKTTAVDHLLNLHFLVAQQVTV